MSADKPSILTITGSLRAGSFNTKVLENAEAELHRLGTVVTRYTELRELPHYDLDLDTEDLLPAIVARLRIAIAASDGVLIATPAFNYMVPGGLKDVIDWGSRPFANRAWMGRSIGILSASPGASGAKQAADYASNILGLLGAVVVKPVTSIAKITDSLTATGDLIDEAKAQVLDTVRALVLSTRGVAIAKNETASRYEIRVGGVFAGVAHYVERANEVELPHTATEDHFGGQGVASVLTRHVVGEIVVSGKTILPSCQFVARYLERYPTGS